MCHGGPAGSRTISSYTWDSPHYMPRDSYSLFFEWDEGVFLEEVVVLTFGDLLSDSEA